MGLIIFCVTVSYQQKSGDYCHTTNMQGEFKYMCKYEVGLCWKSIKYSIQYILYIDTQMNKNVFFVENSFNPYCMIDSSVTGTITTHGEAYMKHRIAGLL